MQFSFGDKINLYGLKMIFLSNTVLIYYPFDKVNITDSTNLNFVRLNDDELPQDVAVKDIELYKKENYFYCVFEQILFKKLYNFRICLMILLIHQ